MAEAPVAFTPLQAAGPAVEAPTAPTAPAAAHGSATTAQHRRNLVALAGGQLVTWSFMLAWTFVVPRRLGASGWGILVTASAVAGILGVVMGLGTRNFLVREMVRAPQRRGEIVATAMVVRLAAVAPALVLLGVYLMAVRFGAQQNLVIAVATAGVVLQLLFEPLEAVFQAVERMEFLAFGDVNDKVAQTAGAIVLVLLGFGVVGLSVWSLAVSALVLALNLFWVRRFVRVRLRTDWARARSMLRSALPYWTMGLFLTFYVFVDTAMLAIMAPAAVVGWYGVPTRLFGTMLFAATILSTAWLPRLVSAHEAGRDRLEAVARVPLDQMLLLALPIALGAAVVSGPLIRDLYGADFEGSVPVMAILAICVLPLYVNIMANQLLVASGRQVVWTRLMIGASVLNPLLNLVAIDVTQARLGNGAIGAAASLLATEILIAAVSVGVILRGVITAASVFRTARALAAALVMTAVVYQAHPLGLVLQVVVGMVTFGGLALAAGVVTGAERGEAAALLRRLRRAR